MNKKEIKIHKNVTYLEDDVIKHIEENHEFKDDGNHKSYFNENIDIKELFDKMKFEITSRNDLKYIQEATSRIYRFHYDSIGYGRNKRVANIISVITDNDLNIITMYPINDEQNNCYINELSEKCLKKDEQTGKTPLRKSQIDKFNRRYGNII